MSWIRPKRTETPAPAPAAAPAPAPAARPGALGIPDDDDEFPIEITSGATPTLSPPTASREAARPASAALSAAGRTTLADDTTVVGTITTASDLWIAGRIDGNIVSSAAVQIAADGAVKGDVSAQQVRIDHGGAVEGGVRTVDAAIAGKVRGPVVATGRLAIASSGEVVGDVTARNLHVDDGATLQGRCTMSPSR